MVDGPAAIHPHHTGLLLLRGIINICHFGLAKPCVINAFDTNYMLSTDEVMANILYMAHNMEEELRGFDLLALAGHAPFIFATVAATRGPHGGCGHNGRGGCGSRGVPNKCSTFGSLAHILSSCTASDDALLKWALAKRKKIVQKYRTPGDNAFGFVNLRCT
jgi:hypothetical protein